MRCGGGQLRVVPTSLYLVELTNELALPYTILHHVSYLSELRIVWYSKYLKLAAATVFPYRLLIPLSEEGSMAVFKVAN